MSAPMRLEQQAQYASWIARFALVSPPNMHHGVQDLLSCPTQYAFWGARFASVSLPTRFIKCKICSSVPPDTLHGVQGFSVPPKTFKEQDLHVCPTKYGSRGTRLLDVSNPIRYMGSKMCFSVAPCLMRCKICLSVTPNMPCGEQDFLWWTTKYTS